MRTQGAAGPDQAWVSAAPRPALGDDTPHAVLWGGPLPPGPSPRAQTRPHCSKGVRGGSPQRLPELPSELTRSGGGARPRNTPGTALTEAPLPTRAMWTQPPPGSPPCTTTSPMGTAAQSRPPPHLAPAQATGGCPRATAKGAHTLKSGTSPPGWPCPRAGRRQAARLRTAASTCPRCLSSGLGTDGRGREARGGTGHVPPWPPTWRPQRRSQLSQHHGRWVWHSAHASWLSAWAGGRRKAPGLEGVSPPLREQVSTLLLESSPITRPGPDGGLGAGPGAPASSHGPEQHIAPLHGIYRPPLRARPPRAAHAATGSKRTLHSLSLQQTAGRGPLSPVAAGLHVWPTEGGGMAGCSRRGVSGEAGGRGGSALGAPCTR